MELIDKKLRFIELRAQGNSYDKTAKLLDVKRQTLVNWGTELQEEIANLKAMALEALYEKYYLTKEAKLTAYGELLQSLREEIADRDLSTVPTDKLVELYLKTSKQAGEEAIEPRFKTSTEMEEDRMDRALLEEITAPRLKAG